MSLVPSLLQAIVHLNGEALVLHVGETPYVVSPTGQIDLASRGLTFEAVMGIVNQLLPAESQQALEEFGAAQYELPAWQEFPGDRFTIVAARGGDDVWAEIRRRRVEEEHYVPAAGMGSAPAVAAEVLDRDVSEDQFESSEAAAAGAPHEEIAFEEAPLLPETADPEPAEEIGAEALEVADLARSPGPVAATDQREPAATGVRPEAPPPIQLLGEAPAVDSEQEALPLAFAAIPRSPAAELPPEQPAGERRHEPGAALEPGRPWPPVWAHEPVVPDMPRPADTAARAFAPAAEAPTRSAEAAAHDTQPPPPGPAPAPDVAPFTPTAVVLPLARSPIRQDVPLPLVEQTMTGLDKLLRLASARGASTLYLSADTRPSMRVHGEVQAIEGTTVLSANEVESLLLTLMPERSAEALRTGGASEWICEIPDVGRVRCVSFRDHRGPGGVFRIMPLRAVTAEQLGLSREIQALATRPDGLVIVAGPRSSGKHTLMSALVDLINRTRREHVIAIESEINVVHERLGSFVSQREARGSSEEMLAMARAALREDPDVLVIEELRSAALMNVALDAAASGHLVIGGYPAPNASGAIDQIIDLYPPQDRRQVQLSLAQHLRGVVAQVLLPKSGGGRLAARELLLNTPAVRGILAEGRTSQLPSAVEGGRGHGMTPLNDALVGFVQSGAVDVREAYKSAVDRTGFVALLKRQGFDTSAIERPA